MTPITFWFDPISPFAHLAFERLPEVLAGHSYSVSYRPVLLPALLAHWGQLGPAEVAPKRDWTYRQVAWLAHRDGVSLQLPAAHPFNPLPLLRLLLACPADGLPNRYQCETVLRHVWHGGAAADDPQRLAALTAQLRPAHDPHSDAVKAALRAHGDAAVARGVFGVPSFELPATLAGAPDDGTTIVLWGYDALDMLAAALRGDPAFAQAWRTPAAVQPGVQRARRA